MQRIDERDLEDSEDGSDDVFFRGRLFTGVAVETDPMTGELRGELSYLDGRRHGPSRTWYPGRVPQSEEYSRYGSRHGLVREWDPHGRLTLEEVWEYYIAIRRRRWNEQGELIEDALPLRDSPGGRQRWRSERERSGREGIIEIENGEFVEKPWPYDHLIPDDLKPR